ncbi:MAG: helix-turn-helix domain-containing protein [Armatimonadetes bacterium]|nr:helix-turn-helix domain-containing protein [Armatimonadota bacterium]
MSHMLTLEQAAEMLQMNPQVVRGYLRKGMLPGNKVGRQWRLLEEDLKAYIRSRYRGKHEISAEVEEDIPENVREWRALSQEEKHKRLMSVMGKYADVPFSSEDLLRERREEVEREEQRWEERLRKWPSS